MKKKVFEIVHVIDAYGNMTKTKGLKMPNGKLLIDNPYFQKRPKIIERKPES